MVRYVWRNRNIDDMVINIEIDIVIMYIISIYSIPLMLIWNLVLLTCGVTMAYNIQKYKKTIKNRLFMWAANTIYYYTYVEHGVKKVASKYEWLYNWIPYYSPHIDSGRIQFIKGNKHVILERIPSQSSSEFDFAYYTIEGRSYILDMDKIVYPPHTDEALQNTDEFISISVQFKDDPTEHVISLHTDTINLYMNGNRITKYVVWYLVKSQLGIDMYGQSYSIQIMDHNVNILKYAEGCVIVIHNDGYYVEQSECAHGSDEVTTYIPKGLR